MSDTLGSGAIHAEHGLVGVIVAVVVQEPEAMGALQATLRNRLQRVVNIRWARRSRPSA